MPSESQSLETDVANNQQILLLTNVKDSRVEFINKMAEAYLPVDTTAVYDDPEGFHKKLIHPDDYSAYLDHLGSLSGGDEKVVFVRLRNKKGNWSKFCFKDRLYQWRSDENNPVVLSLGQEVPVAKAGMGQSSSGEPQKEKTLDFGPHKNEYEEMFQALDEAFCIIELIFDKEGKPVDYLYLQTNPAFEKQLNFTNVNGKTIREVVPEYESGMLGTLTKVATTGEPVRLEFTSESICNRWLDLHAMKVGNKYSRRVALLFRDITERKRAEEELIKAQATLKEKAARDKKDLEENRELLQTVFDTHNQAIAVFQTLYNEDGSIRDFKFIKVNKVLQEMYLEKEVLGQTYLETTKYGVEMGMFDAFKKVMTSGQPIDNEFYFDKEGYHHWFRMTARPQKDLLIATIEDITVRKKESLEFEETARFKKELIRATPETILIIDLNNFSVDYINKDIFPEAGMTKEKIQGMPLADILPFIHPRDREKMIGLHKKLLKATDSDVFDIELRLKLRGISWEWFNVRGKIFKRRDKSWVDQYVLLVRNITDQKNTEKDLLEAKKLSIQGEVARTLAHELRNPIASIGMVGEVLAKKINIKEDSSFSNYFNILSRSTKTLNSLVSNLLNSSNYTPANLKKEDLADIMNKAIGKASDRIYLEGIRLVKNYEGTYPILADSEKLEIALLNIIVNASEATTPGKGVIEIEITEHASDFRLNISDNGHGMEKDQIDRLFEAFYTNKSTGVGVGLNSVKTILEEHDAQYKVESSPGEGTCFRIFFPNVQKE